MTAAAGPNPLGGMAASGGAMQSANMSLAVKFALRELRGGLTGFYVFLACIALGVVRKGLDAPGTELELEVYGQKHKAVVQADQPLWDPENERLRA